MAALPAAASGLGVLSEGAVVPVRSADAPPKYVQEAMPPAPAPAPAPTPVKRRRGRPTKEQLHRQQRERILRGEPRPPPPPPPLAASALPRGEPLDGMDVSVAYAMAALPIPGQMSKKLGPALSVRRFSHVKTVIPGSLLVPMSADDAENRRGRKRKTPRLSFVLPSGTRVPLQQPIHPSCLDEWLGRYWYIREYQQHKPENCPDPTICKRHSLGTHSSSIMLRARPARPKYTDSVPPTLSQVELYTLSISGSVVVHFKCYTYPVLV